MNYNGIQSDVCTISHHVCWHGRQKKKAYVEHAYLGEQVHLRCVLYNKPVMSDLIKKYMYFF